MELTPTPHIGAERGEIAESILLPGDPLRARMIAEKFFTDPVQFNSTRNMLGFTGTWNGKRISVMGTGMGCPSMGIYSHELIHAYGVRELIRVGTAGAMNEKVKVRDLVLAMGACSNTGYTKLFGLPGEFSCISSFRLLRKAAEAAEKHGLSFHVGNVLTSDMFYSPVKRKNSARFCGYGCSGGRNGDSSPLCKRCAGRCGRPYHLYGFRFHGDRRNHHGRREGNFFSGHGTGGAGNAFLIRGREDSLLRFLDFLTELR